MSEPDDAVRDLLAAYALDALDDEDRRAVERLLARDPAAAREVAGFQAVAAELGSAVETAPPPELRAEVLAAARRTPQVAAAHPSPQVALAPSSTPVTAVGDAAEPVVDGDAVPTAPADAATVTPIASRRRARTRWVAIAAAFLVGAAVPTGIAIHQAHQLDHVQSQQAALASLLSDPSASVVHAPVTGGGQATAVVTSDRALFAVTGVPEPAAGHVYQLWVVADGTMTSAGIMTSGGDQHALVSAGYAHGDSLAMTVEPDGGSAQPTTQPIVVLTPA